MYIATLLAAMALFVNPASTLPEPMLVLVTQPGCAPCEKLQSTLQHMRDNGMLGAGTFFVADLATMPVTARAMLQNGPGATPQLLKFVPVGRLVGNQTERQVAAWLAAPTAEVAPPVDLVLPPPIEAPGDCAGGTCSATPRIGPPLPNAASVPILFPMTKQLVDLGKATTGAVLFQAVLHPVLCQTAQACAEEMAATRRQGHGSWARRKPELQLRVGGSVEEICAATWVTTGDDPVAVAKDLRWSWKHLPGHWALLTGPAKAYGCGVARGTNGVWYGCIQIQVK